MKKATIGTRIRHVPDLKSAGAALTQGALMVVVGESGSELVHVIFARNRLGNYVHDHAGLGWLTCEPVRLKEYKKRALPTFQTSFRLAAQFRQSLIDALPREANRKKEPPSAISTSDFKKLMEAARKNGKRTG